ncbi:hypothetical protein VNO77_19413 [Canavalia gladiata]|uniref:cellulase n=1 Tax=Canavalia gladiata TaxID=3824 RepID=A0AAN9LRH5_CANGL
MGTRVKEEGVHVLKSWLQLVDKVATNYGALSIGVQVSSTLSLSELSNSSLGLKDNVENKNYGDERRSRSSPFSPSSLADRRTIADERSTLFPRKPWLVRETLLILRRYYWSQSYSSRATLQIRISDGIHDHNMTWNAIEFENTTPPNELRNALVAIRWATDYLLEAVSRPNRIFVQVSDPTSAHSCYERPRDMDTSRKVYDADASNPALALPLEAPGAGGVIARWNLPATPYPPELREVVSGTQHATMARGSQ